MNDWQNEEYRLLKKAFFEKAENLSAERVKIVSMETNDDDSSDDIRGL